MSLLVSSSPLTDLVLRPGIGKTGKPINIRTNFFKLASFCNNNVYHYDVTIDPSSNPSVNRRVWDALSIAESQGIFSQAAVLFDGRRNAFSTTKLPLGDTHAAKFQVTVDNRSGQQDPRNTFTINLQKVNKVVMNELNEFIQSKSSLTPNCLSAIMVLDILIKQVPSAEYPKIGHSFYYPTGSGPLANGVVAWHGYYQSARAAKGKMMINIDISATTFYQPGPLVNLVSSMLGRRSAEELRRGINEFDLRKLIRLLKGLKVKITHRGEQALYYNIIGLSSKSTDRLTFKDQNGQETIITQYFERRYNKRLNYSFLPCVMIKKDAFLPMEMCSVEPGHRYNKNLNPAQTAEMIKFTCKKPDVRANMIVKGLELLKYANNPYMQAFDTTVKPEMAMIKARILPAPSISYHRTSTQQPSFVPQKGVWTLRGKKMVQGATLGSWSVVNFAGAIPDAVIKKFIRALCEEFTMKGLNIVKRDPPIMNCDPQGNIEKALKEAYLKAGNAARARPQLIVCILPSLNTPLYGEIKRVTDTIIGIPSQCLQSKHFNTANAQYCANVCLKVNIKLGGTNATLNPQQVPFITSKPTIIIGADVNHPAPGDDPNKPSFAAICGSLDARATTYCSSIRVQSRRTEIADLASMIKEILKNFYTNSGQKPQRILFYRDGVSEGQFKKVMDDEVAAVKAACRSVEAGYNPTLTFVVVQKRHHARFFPMSPENVDRSGNCLPGTVVDTDIIHPFEFDFYLQSHAGLQGTSRPAHYHVLYDENKFTADALQELTYHLCYIYGRCSSSVSLIPAVYYADLLAARARYHRPGGGSTDIESVRSEDTLGTEAELKAYATVKPELANVMYFM